MRRLGVVLAVLLAVGLVMAQGPAKAPKPGPDHKRMGYFVGTWTGEAESKASPFGPAGKSSSTQTCEWYNGGFALVCNDTGSAGPVQWKGTSLMAYDPETKMYRYSSVNNMGESDQATGTVKGKVWTWTSEGKKGGKPFKGVFTITEVSPTSYTYKWDASFGGGPVETLMSGKNTKSK